MFRSRTPPAPQCMAGGWIMGVLCPSNAVRTWGLAAGGYGDVTQKGAFLSPAPSLPVSPCFWAAQGEHHSLPSDAQSLPWDQLTTDQNHKPLPSKQPEPMTSSLPGEAAHKAGQGQHWQLGFQGCSHCAHSSTSWAEGAMWLPGARTLELAPDAGSGILSRTRLNRVRG